MSGAEDDCPPGRGWTGQPQQHPLWCWAAVLSVVAHHLGHDLDQCAAASAVKDPGGPGCCAGGGDACFAAASDGEMLEALDGLGVDAQPVDVGDAVALTQALAAGGVVWMAQATLRGDHYTLVVGHDGRTGMYQVLDSLVVSAADRGASRASERDVHGLARRGFVLRPRTGAWRRERRGRALTPSLPQAEGGIAGIVDGLLAERGEAWGPVVVEPAHRRAQDVLRQLVFDLYWVQVADHRRGYGLRGADGRWDRVVLGQGTLPHADQPFGIGLVELHGRDDAR